MHTRSKKQPLLFDREVEKTAKKNRKQVREVGASRIARKKTVEVITPTIEDMENQHLMKRENETDAAYYQRLINVGIERERAAQAEAARVLAEQERNRTCLDPIRPRFDERTGIAEAILPANQNFKVDSYTLGLLKDMPFRGRINDNPLEHLTRFRDAVSFNQYANISSDQVNLRLFPITLAESARDWFDEIPRGSITTWEELKNQFLSKFFTPAMTHAFITEITNFRQKDDESLAGAWDRFKGLLRKCPHHGLDQSALVRIFHQGLGTYDASGLDSTAGGSVMTRPPQEILDLIERITTHSARAHQSSRRPTGIYEVHPKVYHEARTEGQNVVLNQLDKLAKNQEAIEKSISKLVQGHGTVKAVRFHECEICGEEHRCEDCPNVVHTGSESINFVQNQRFPYNNRQTMQSNLSYGNNRNILNPPKPFGTQEPSQPTMRELLAQLTQTQIQNSAQLAHLGNLATDQAKTNEGVANDIKEIKSTLGRVCEALNDREPGKFPGNAKNPRNEQLKAIHLRSGKELASTSEPRDEEVKSQPKSSIDLTNESIVEINRNAKEDKEPLKEEMPKIERKYPDPPYPSRLQKSKQETGYSKFYDMLKRLTINIPFAEALEQIPSYAKYMKDILSKKKKLGNNDIVSLTEGCSAIFHRKLPQKSKDPGTFVVPVDIGNEYCGKGLCDLGASINLMPMSVFRKLHLEGDLKPTLMTLQLADRSIIHP